MQSSFSDLEYSAKKKLTRRDRFLGGIHAATPWAALEAEIEPFYPKGRRSYPNSIKLVAYCGLLSFVTRCSIEM